MVGQLRAITSIIGQWTRKRYVQRQYLGTPYYVQDYYLLQFTGDKPRVPVVHFHEVGWRLHLNPSPFFDVAHYCAVNDDVRRAQVNPVIHYLRDGWKEGRSPHPNFSRLAFLRAHPTFDPSGQDPAARCIELYGTFNWNVREQALPRLEANEEYITISKSGYFDQRYYLSTYPDVAASGMDPLQHYLKHGCNENRNPSAEFDTQYYRQANLGIEDNEICPLVHFVTIGRQEGRRARSPDTITLVDNTTETPANIGPSLSVALHVHVYYLELLEEVVQYLKNLPENTYVRFTTASKIDKSFIERLVSRLIPTLCFDVVAVPNRGRDLAPMFIGAGQLWEDFDIVGHLHTKRSVHTSFGDNWRRYLFDQMLGSKQRIMSIIRVLSDDKSIGMLYPENYFEIRQFVEWGKNSERILEVLRDVGVDIDNLPSIPEFGASSMAWFRSKSMEQLRRRFSSIEDFEEENGQLDFTVAHVLERALALAVRGNGFRALAYYSPLRPTRAIIPMLHAAQSSDESAGVRWRRDTPAIMINRLVPLTPLTRWFNEERLEIHWIIPDFAEGAGGHMSIFRIVEFLAKFGHQQTVWIQNASNHSTPDSAMRRIKAWYRPIPDAVIVRFLPDDVTQISGDLVIATDCWTAYPASCVRAVKERFYFMQDFEPAFHPMGDKYVAAEATYNMGFAAICAGDWLTSKARQYQMWARSWHLASDEQHYFPGRRRDGVVSPNQAYKIAFYARRYTPRRAVDLGIAALEELSLRKIPFVAHFFGENGLELGPTSFDLVQHGIMTPEELGGLYRDADIGLVFSMTNYSLVSLEMMACGLAVVEIDGESTRAIFGDNEVEFAEPNPFGVADAIERLIRDPSRRFSQIVRATRWLEGFSWEHSASRVEQALIERLTESGYRPIKPQSVCAPAPLCKTHVSVVIPTFNAGSGLHRVLERLVSQVTEFKFDVLVVDSGSTDETIEIIKGFSANNVRLHEIPNSDFRHGGTRNLAISMSEGRYVALLTQDALPADDRWLRSLISGFRRSDRVAGVIGRHLAYAEHGPFVERDLQAMFDRFADYPDVYSIERGLPSFIYRGGITWRMIMHFYSDNNSAMDRSVWKVVPYPDVDWGEDMVWVWTILQLGFEKVYVDDARVFHSHDFKPSAHFDSSFMEGRLFKTYFGYDLTGDQRSREVSLEAENRRDELFALKRRISFRDLERRKIRNKLTIEGRRAGILAALAGAPWVTS